VSISNSIAGTLFAFEGASPGVCEGEFGKRATPELVARPGKQCLILKL